MRQTAARLFERIDSAPTRMKRLVRSLSDSHEINLCTSVILSENKERREREREREKKNTKSAPINHGDIRDSPKDTRLYSNAHDVHTHTFLQITPWPCAEIVDKCVCVCDRWEWESACHNTSSV